MSRKLLIITLGVTVLLGGTGVTALYFGGKDLIMEDGSSAVGGECTDIQTMVLKTPSNHLWLRRFIRMENSTGPERVRTALRIAGLLAQKNAVDLIHVSVLDIHGPDKRAYMRERAIGAEVLIALKPENLPEMKAPAMASYYEGPVSDEGRFYGDKVVVDIDEIGSMMTAMRTVQEKPDCVTAVKEGAEDAKADAHGAKNKKEKKNEHGEKPANEHGDAPANDHAEKPADAKAHGQEPAKEQSFVESMLSMVGLGGSEEATPENHEAVAEEPADPASDNPDAKPVSHDASSTSHETAPAEEPSQLEDHATSDKSKPDQHSEAAASPDH